MAVTRIAHTNWTGGLTDGSGTVFFDSSGIGAYEVSWPARAEQPGGKTSPEELIAAALSSCYSMALSHELNKRGTAAENIDTQARVTLEPGAGITAIHLSVRASLVTESRGPHVEPASRGPHIGPADQPADAPASRGPHIGPASRGPHIGPASRGPHVVDPDGFRALAELAMANCPLSQALAGVKITLDAELES